MKNKSQLKRLNSFAYGHTSIEIQFISKTSTSPTILIKRKKEKEE